MDGYLIITANIDDSESKDLCNILLTRDGCVNSGGVLPSNDIPYVRISGSQIELEKIKSKDDLKTSIQSNVITISGYPPLIFTHQHRIVTKFFQCSDFIR